MNRDDISKMKKAQILERISLIFDDRKEGMICFEKRILEDLKPIDIERLNEFHAKKVLMVTRKDDYFVGIRANHFNVEVGYIESKDNLFYLITANHKGYRAMTLISDTKTKID